MNTRRTLLLAAGAAAAWPALAQRPQLPHPASLAEELAAAARRRKALVLMVSLEHCPHCRIVRESYLLPLRAEGQPVVQIEMDRSLPLLDLGGRAATHEQLARAFGVQVAPTVLFIGRGGREAADRITGVPLLDFYGAYLQERVDKANRSFA